MDPKIHGLVEENQSSRGHCQGPREYIQGKDPSQKYWDTPWFQRINLQVRSQPLHGPAPLFKHPVCFLSLGQGSIIKAG